MGIFHAGTTLKDRLKPPNTRNKSRIALRLTLPVVHQSGLSKLSATLPEPQSPCFTYQLCKKVTVELMINVGMSVWVNGVF